ncbi:hypothetical protein HAX54_025032 [Datura stramonium]|uniref:Disease resistance protein winged helix domain-containing protein n=1 Tax=Datura stramonium TaxID=4076 RepID=A0ABS8V1Q9_DATST|nr:hypothetical protein [Datura stramonium]
MAYAGVLSLLQTARQGQTAEMLDSLRDTAEYFQNVLEEASKIRSTRDVDVDADDQILELSGDSIVTLLLLQVIIQWQIGKIPSTLTSWKDVAKTLGKIVASHPDKCLGVLGLSYHHLPIHLKLCFLSMGSFPEDFHVETWRLIQLWIAEGFIRTSEGDKSMEEVAVDYLEELISRNLIMVRKGDLMVR